MVSVTLSPASSVPDDGDTVTSPSRVAGAETDQETGPPLAVSVSDPPSSGLSSTVVGDTDSVAALDDPPVVTVTVAPGVVADTSVVGLVVSSPPPGSVVVPAAPLVV